MKKGLLFLAFIALFTTFEAKSQCGAVSLIGEFNGWAGDYAMDQDVSNPNVWSAIITLTGDMNLFNEPDIIEVKFRQDASWAVNWGAPDFPHGFGYQDGPNIPLPIDIQDGTTYAVVFNCASGEYYFGVYGQKEVPISGWALVIGIALITILAVWRFRNLS